VRTGKVLAELNGLAGPGTAVAWSPDGRLAAAVTTYRNLLIWDARSGKVVQQEQIDLPLYTVAFTPDSRQVAVAGGDDTGGRLLILPAP
jgi:WD40 repeat protein